MSGVTALPVIATLGARPALPFVLETRPFDSEGQLVQTILERLNSLQELATQSQNELVNLRRLNVEILEAMRQQPPRPEPVAPPPTTRVETAQRINLRLLGPFQAAVGESPIVSWPGKKARLLLAYLAMERGRMVPKDLLIELFWPGARSDRGANNLSIAIYQIRTSIAAISQQATQAVIVRQGLYGLDPALVDVDLWHLQSDLEKARQALERRESDRVHEHLLSAVGFYRDELLASDLYEEWTMEPRRTLGAACHKALAWLALESSEQGEWPGVLDFSRRMLQHDPCDEAAHRLLITAYWKMGNRRQAQQQYELCKEALDSELSVEPSEETRLLYAQVTKAG